MVEQLEHELNELAAGDREPVERLLAVTLRAIRESGITRSEVSRMAGELVERTAAAELRLLEVQNMLNRVEMWREITSQTASRSDLGVTRQALDQRRKRGRLIGLRTPNATAYRYPLWQFTDEMEPRPQVQTVIRAAHDVGLSNLELHRLMLSDEAGGGQPPASILKEGDLDRVISIIRAHGDEVAA
jgi:hypothetical protein